ncbi:MAG: M48 family metalloprotease, partial [Geminicoccaceae bacterium]|nr:M48 family metalloprotease [Geminicoccaceae bacterium]
FVAGGQNLFLHTGLIVAAKTPERLAGTIAHETGHIAGGHLSRTGQAGEAAAAEAMLGALLGAAAAFAGAPQLGTAIIAGGATVAQRGILKFTRGQEQSADQAGVTYMARIGLPPTGLREMFETLQRQNLRISDAGSEFLQTHPLTSNRFAFLEHADAVSPLHGKSFPPAMRVAYDRVVAKLDGFLDEPERVLREHAGDAFADRYARAVARFRRGEVDEALGLVRGLEAEAPGDPWVLELEGQIRFESGQVKAAIAPYRAADGAAPGEALLQLGLARALMEGDGSAPALEEAATLLRRATDREPRNPGLWRFLGIALGRLGREGEASLALAETAVLAGEREDAFLHLARAERLIGPSDPAWLRLQDLRRSAEEIEPPRRG